MASAAVEKLAFPDAKKKYIINVLDPVLEEMVQEMLSVMPNDPVEYMKAWLRRKGNIMGMTSAKSMETKNADMKKELASMEAFVADVGEIVGKGEANKSEAVSDEEDEDDDVEDDEMPPPPPPETRKARQSVSAEAYGAWNIKKEFTAPVYEKSDEQKASIKQILMNSFLFKSLEEKDLTVIIGATKEKTFEAGTRIIKEGDDGDCLFIIEEGNPECKKNIDGAEKVVKTCKPGDVFGELALLYNNPRAATVDAVDKCLCWELDRETFTNIVKEAATKQHEKWEGFFSKVGILLSLSQHERQLLGDALCPETFKKDDFVVKQNDPGDKFYILEEGTLAVMKSMDGGEAKNMMEYTSGDYFGELALLMNRPRAASVQVTSESAKVLSLDRKTFKNLLGKVEDVLKKKSKDYQ